MPLLAITHIMITNGETKPFRLSLTESKTNVITHSEFYYFSNALSRARDLSRIFHANIIINCELTPEQSDYTGEEDE